MSPRWGYIFVALVTSACISQAAFDESHETVSAVEVDDASGSAYICGATSSSVGEAPAGGGDVWIAKYGPNGNQLWLDQLGTASSDGPSGLGVDAFGNVYIGGSTHTAMEPGDPHLGLTDGWLAKYSPSGQLLWLNNIGGAGHEAVLDVAADAFGNVYICGHTTGNLGLSNAGGNDVFVAKYSTAGSLLWIRQFGTGVQDFPLGIASDRAGNVAVAGYTEGTLTGRGTGSRDYWVARYDSAGALKWIRQRGTRDAEKATDVSFAPNGSIIVAGTTYGSLASFSRSSHADAWLASYTSAGRLSWTRQFGTPETDYLHDVAVNASTIVLGGGSWQGPGFEDAFFAELTTKGKILSTTVFGGHEAEAIQAVDFDQAGNLYVGLEITESFSEGRLGSDAFLVKQNKGGTVQWISEIADDGANANARVLLSAAPAPAFSYSLTPSDTDPAINNWNNPHLAYVNQVPSRDGKLVVFFPGSYAQTRAYATLTKQLAVEGYHTIGLQYPNSFDVISLCDDVSGTNPNCQEQVRNEILTGQDTSTYVAVSPANSIINRLVKALQSLHAQHPTQGWNAWLDGNNQPVWSQIYFAGHSQGGGHALFIGKRFSVGRVMLFCAPQDQLPNGTPAPWVIAAGATPLSKHFGFGHVNDEFFPRYSANWNAMGLLAFGSQSAEQSVAPFSGAHFIVTGVAPQGGKMTGVKCHDSPATDYATPFLLNGTPLYGSEGVWQHMVNAP